MTPGRAALVGLIKAYLVGHLDPLVTLLELHKLVYFMQEAGEPLRLDFAKGTYGPYANNLRHVMQSMEGHYTSGYFGADTPTAEIAVLPGAEEEAEAILASSRTTGKRFARVVALVKGFETPHGLELLATVHWVARRETAVNLEEVVRRVYEWGPRKARFTPGQIQLAYETLAEKEWVQPFPIAFAG
jgi:O-acetyl-ADP-ribose deacetylase (regulator of RNase III)